MRLEIMNLGRYRCKCYVYRETGIPIVFLHGYMFTSDIWRDINILQFLEEKNIPYLAIDMPYGRRSNCSPHTRDPDENIYVLREAMHALFPNLEPIIVGASLGGYIALKYMVRHPVAGLILIGPVNVFEKELVNHYKNIEFPVKIIVGGKDDVVDINDMYKLRNMIPGSKLVIYEKARHPAYLDHPDRFKNDLFELYKSVLNR